MINPASAATRLGTESAFQVLAKANALAAGGKSIINLGIGQPDFQTPPHIVEAGIKALRDGHHGYTAANGIPQLREAVASELEGRAGCPLDPERVLIVPGGKMTMFFALLLLGEPGAEIIYPNPGFPIYESVIKFSGATPVPLHLRERDGFAFDPDALLDLVTDKTRLIILNSPANPTGGVTPRSAFDRLAEGLEAYPNTAILSDEIYCKLLYDGEAHASPLAYDSLRERTILLDGWSKTYAMTGWRLGYSYWPKEISDLATRLAINSNSCVNASAQFAGLAALTGPQDCVEEMARAFDSRRRHLVKRLNEIDGISCITPKGAFYAFPNITGTGRSSMQLQENLLDQTGVAAIAGTSFGQFGEGYLRLSYANSLENIEEALQRMERFLAG